MTRTTLTGAALACFSASIACAGDLNPPAGPVAPTMKTLVEVEPRTPIHQADVPVTITEPGSYYLAENLVFPVATTGTVIMISVENVTLDLNGFTIDGQDVDGDADSVVGIAANVDDALIRNGRVVDTAICVRAQSTRRVFIDSVVATPIDGGIGIQTSNDATLSNCEVNGGAVCYDFTVSSDFVARGCIARSATDACFDFRFNIDGHVEDCVAHGGIYGFRLGSMADDIVIVGCTANSSSIGFADLSGQTNFLYRNIAVRNNVAYQNVANVSANPATAGPWDNVSQ